ncbi:MAG: beta-ketoacyl-ACP synthase III [Magnetovibrionaceae bacterium]
MNPSNPAPTRRSIVTGTGSYLPANCVSNDELAKTVDTSDDWIRSRSGITQRHFAAEGELTSDLALAASRAALDAAGITGSDLDLIVLATTTPDLTFPATATKVQAELGMTGGAAFDVQAVCAGFVYALSVADNMIKGGMADRALVIGAETFSRLLDWNDRNTCVLFGDGAGAIVLEAGEGIGPQDRGILSTHLHSDGRLNNILFVDSGASSGDAVGKVRMEGKEVFRHAVVNLVDIVHEALGANDLTPADLDWLIPHQANRRIIDGTGKKLGLSPDKVVVTVDRHANTSAASIPLALDEAVRDGRITSGDLVLLEGIGGGMAWGAGLIRW